MSFNGMLPVHLATVDLSPLGEQLLAAGGIAVTVLTALWIAWTRTTPQAVPVRVPSRRYPPRR